jgi:hypothetical protein
MLCEQHIRLLDTTVGTFLGPPFGNMAAKYHNKKVVRGRCRQSDSGIEEPDILLCTTIKGVHYFIFSYLHY